jgi:hypothetical protein
MIFCSKCFNDAEIKPIIDSIGVTGLCPTCGANNVHLYDTDKNIELTELFEDLISIYTPVSLLPSYYPKSEVGLLKDELLNKWNIFNNLNASKVYSIVTSICKEKYEETPQPFDSPVGISELYDQEYISDHSLLKTNSWEDFTISLKSVNRFHTNFINLEILEKFCSYIRKRYEKGTIFYRGRISPESGYSIKEMSAPPPFKTTAGRANCEGISCLYLASDPTTTIHEVRAGAFDYITIGVFELTQDIIVIDLKSIDRISPFLVDLDTREHAINKEHLNKINKEMGKALRRNDSPLDYIPTQYISDFIKSLQIDEADGGKYAGIEYNSTMNSGGFNLAIYYPELFECVGTNVFKVQSLKYDTCTLG